VYAARCDAFAEIHVHLGSGRSLLPTVAGARCCSCCETCLFVYTFLHSHTLVRTVRNSTTNSRHYVWDPSSHDSSSKNAECYLPMITSRWHPRRRKRRSQSTLELEPNDFASAQLENWTPPVPPTTEPKALQSLKVSASTSTSNLIVNLGKGRMEKTP
jgi:hypothetical protein